MPAREVLQKLLTGASAAALVEDGSHEVGGVVVRAVDLADRRTPQQVLAAYGIDGAPEFVDVARFELPALAQLGDPPSTVTTSGFLRGDGVVAAWELSPTRWSHGAEYWRIRSDGEQRVLSSYAGAAQGWRGARGWRSPSPLVGPRARWRGRDLPADVVGDGVMLTALTESELDGWQHVRDGVFATGVPLGEVELFETIVTARVHDVAVRILASDGEHARVQLIGPGSDDPQLVHRVGADAIEPGVFQARVPVADIEDRQGVENVVTTPR